MERFTMTAVLILEPNPASLARLTGSLKQWRELVPFPVSSAIGACELMECLRPDVLLLGSRLGAGERRALVDGMRTLPGEPVPLLCLHPGS